jgi:hypothetical protein
MIERLIDWLIAKPDTNSAPLPAKFLSAAVRAELGLTGTQKVNLYNTHTGTIKEPAIVLQAQEGGDPTNNIGAMGGGNLATYVLLANCSAYGLDSVQAKNRAALMSFSVRQALEEISVAAMISDLVHLHPDSGVVMEKIVSFRVLPDNSRPPAGGTDDGVDATQKGNKWVARRVVRCEVGVFSR